MFRRGRRLVDGHLVDDAGPGRPRRWYYGRLFLVTIAFLFCIVTNPANQEWMDRFPRAWKSANSSRRTQDDEDIDLQLYAQKLYRAYEILTSPDDASSSSRTQSGNGVVVNYLLFSVRVVTKRNKPRLQILGAGQTSQCNLEKSQVCRLAHDFLLLPRNPSLRRCTKRKDLNKLQELENLLWYQEPQERRYFQAYQLLLGWCLVALVLTLIQDTSQPSSYHPLVEAMLRGFWPMPKRRLSSTFVSLVDVWLFMAPTLAVMDEQIAHQAQKSIFRLTTEDSNLNYAFAVSVFMIATSGFGNVMSFFLANWNNLDVILWNGHGGMATSPARSGYSSDLWAAAALGYLRAFCKEDGYSNAAQCLSLFGHLNWQVTIVSAIWTRIAFQILVLNESVSHVFATMGLWLAADSIGNIIGEYQVEHHFALVAFSNIIDGVDRFFSSLFG